MNLSRMLDARAAAGRPITVGVIGAGKFGAMFLAMAVRRPGVHVAVIADLSPARARANLERIGWEKDRAAAPGLDAALASGGTVVTEDAAAVNDPRIEEVVEYVPQSSAGVSGGETTGT